MKSPLLQAFREKRAIPAFNFYNLESAMAICRAASESKAPVILAASESAIKYMGDVFAAFIAKGPIPVHLDHGKSLEAAKHAINLGFKSVMIDGSHLSFDENVRLTKRVVDYAHKRGVWVEAELGVLCGIEDDVKGRKCAFTNPDHARRFVELSGCDSLAIAIGTSHGAYKGDGKLRFDILREIHALLPRTPLVLHGASQIPAKYARILGLKGAEGIVASDIRRSIGLGIAKVNVDSDARLAWTATMKNMFMKGSGDFDPRHYLSKASDEMVALYKKEIKLIYG